MDIGTAKIAFLAKTIVVQEMSLRALVATFAVLIRGALLDYVP